MPGRGQKRGIKAETAKKSSLTAALQRADFGSDPMILWLLRC